MSRIIHRSCTSLGWWVSGLVLLAVGWWGLPLIQSDQFENHFFGLFYYSILAGIALFWACPSEQRFDVLAGQAQFERRTTVLGIATLWRQVTPLSAFSEIRLEQDPNLFRKDTVWVIVAGEGENAERFAFANFSATFAHIEKAKAIAQALSQATGLPIDLPNLHDGIE